MSKTHNYSVRSTKLTASSFEALPDAEKDRILEEIEAETPEDRLAASRPLTAREKADWNAFKRKATRSKANRNGVARVSVNVEQSLLKKADVYAKRHNLNRSELFARSLKQLVGNSVSKI